MTSNIFSQLKSPTRGARSFYKQLRSGESDEYDPGLDEENLGHRFDGFHAEELGISDSRMTVESAALDPKGKGKATSRRDTHIRSPTGLLPRWNQQDDDGDNEVPASLLMEPNEVMNLHTTSPRRATRSSNPRSPAAAGPSSARSRGQWEAVTAQQLLHQDDPYSASTGKQPIPVARGAVSNNPREKALWRWVNTSNLDSFMRDVYDYYEGGGLWCILCANALWLM
jgi:autophagy-related protein 9